MSQSITIPTAVSPLPLPPGEALYYALFECALSTSVSLPSELNSSSVLSLCTQALSELEQAYGSQPKATWLQELQQIYKFLDLMQIGLIRAERPWGIFNRFNLYRRMMLHQLKAAHCYRQAILQGVLD